MHTIAGSQTAVTDILDQALYIDIKMENIKTRSANA